MAGTPIASILRGARERAGWSREVLAYHSGLSCAAIAQIESGRRQNVRIASLAALAGALGVSIDYLAGGTPRAHGGLLEHRAFVYESDSAFLTTIVPFLREGIQRHDALLVVTTSPQIRRLRTALGRDATNVDFFSSSGWYRSPLEALNKYQTYVEGQVNDGARWMRIIGEPIWTGRSASDIRRWIRYEAVINLSFAAWPATVMCPYDARSVSPAIIESSHRTHPELAEGARVTLSSHYGQPEQLLLSNGRAAARQE